MVTYIIGKAYDKKFLRHNIKKKLSDFDRQKKNLLSTGGKQKSLQATKTIAPPSQISYGASLINRPAFYETLCLVGQISVLPGADLAFQ